MTTAGVQAGIAHERNASKSNRSHCIKSKAFWLAPMRAGAGLFYRYLRRRDPAVSPSPIRG
jgi:hypothetical protein